jgi:hypothetical protein
MKLVLICKLRREMEGIERIASKIGATEREENCAYRCFAEGRVCKLTMCISNNK